MELFKGMNMRHIGPATMSGRVTSIDAVANDPTIIYVGTASGGLWKSESGGTKWTSIFDDQPVASIGAVTIDQNNPDVIWAGTGEGNPRNSHTSGAGIFRSLDAGHTWEAKGLKNTRLIHRVIVHRDEPNTVFVAAMGSAWGPNKERGVYRTKDGGETWENILFVNDSTGCADLVVDPSNPNKLIAAMWEYGRKPYFFNSGGEGSGMYVSHDGGDTWKKRTDEDGLPKGNLGRMGLAISASNPKICYALVEAKEIALYKSTDGGFNWKKKATDNAGNRPFYYADIFVNPHDAKEVWSLWSVVSRSDDGGSTFQTVIPYSGVHPDHHAFWISPTDPNFMMDGNDGGLNISRDGGNTWQYVSNLPLGQFYHINYDMDIPYHVYGGMQDNGSWQGPGYKWGWNSISNEDWKEISFGDGFDVVSNRSDSRYAYSMWQGGNLTETDIETGESRYIRPMHPDSAVLRFNWNAALAQDPFEDCGLYYGSQFVHYSPDCGKSWELISPDLSTNDSTKQQQAKSGGLTFDVTDAENYTTVVCISPSPHDKNVIWAGTDDGNIQVTRDHGQTWTNVAKNIKGLPANPWIPQIEVSPHNDGEAFAVVNNYRQNDWHPYVYYTNDYGSKWTRIVSDSDVSGHCLSIVQDPVEPKLLFLGTENGLYVSFDKGINWNQWEHDYPNISTMDMKIHPRENDLIVGTFARAAYILDDITPLRRVAASGTSGFENKIDIISVPDAYQAGSGRDPGVRFPGDMKWRGENRWSGARIQYYCEMPEEKKEGDKEEEKKKSADDKKSKKDKGNDGKKATVHILSLEGDSLRTFTTEPDTTGINLTRWGLDTKGVRRPSRRERKSDADQPGGGMAVAPGTYKVVMEYRGDRDSTEVVVHYDPRLDYDPSVRAAQKVLLDRWETMVSKADQGFEQTKAGLKTIKAVKTHLTNVEDSLKKDVLAIADSLSKEINKIQDLYMNPKDAKGYLDDNHLLTTYIWKSRSYIMTGGQAPGANAEVALVFAEGKIEEVVVLINDVFGETWSDWRKEVEALESSPFEDVEKID